MEITTQNLTKKYGSKVAVENINLSVKPGQVLGLLGPNGAGKSTTIKMLSGQIKPSSGTVTIDGQENSYVTSNQRSKIGIMPQEIIIWDDLTIRENIQFAATLQKLSSNEIKKRTEELIKVLKFEKEVNTLAKNLSGGYKRRLNLANSIVHSPSVLFLDEPTPGIDAQSRRFLMDYIQDLARNENYAIVLTDHYLDEAEKLSDYVVIIDQGKVIAEGNIPSLKKNYGDGSILQVDFEDEVSEQLLEKLRKILEKTFNKDTKKRNQTLSVLVDNPITSMQKAIKVFDDNNVNPLNISVKEPSLEDIFLLLTGKDIRE